MGADGSDATRWAARPRLATAVRVAVFLGPVLTSFAAAWVATRMLPPSSGPAGQAVHLGVLIVVSTVVLVVLDRGARRLLPLVTLLDLSLLFPQSAPSRLRVAREAIRRRPIEEQLARVREAGADPSTAATEILALVAALSSHDRPTRGHAERVRMFTDLVAEQMRLPQKDRDLLRWAAILHDIGKLRVPVAVLNKPGKPDADEWTLLKAHPVHGAEIAGALLPWLGEWGTVIVEHHERWDGTGYPNGLAGREIHLGSRIVSVADAYDVMTSARAYKRPVSRAAAYQELIRFSGTQFDPAAVRAMVSVAAPRLRRAQGLLAWLADVPLVATHVVPAATLARVVGAGAVATGAVAGGALATPPAPSPTTVVAAPSTAGDQDEKRAGQPAAAQAPLERAVAHSQSPAEAHYLLGLVRRDRRDIPAAIESLERAVQISSTMTAAREELADLYGGNARPQDEMRQLQALASSDPHVERRIAIALAEARHGEFDGALRTLAAAGAADNTPPDSRIHLALGRIHLMRAERTGDRSAAVRARDVLEQALGGTARRSEGLALYGRALFLSGDIGAAERILVEAAATSPVSTQVFAYLADAAERLGHALDARDALVRLDALEGDTVSAEIRAARLRRTGMLSLRGGDARTAALALAQAVDAGLNDLETLTSLAQARWESGDVHGARETLDRALALAPRDPGAPAAQPDVRSIKVIADPGDRAARRPRS